MRYPPYPSGNVNRREWLTTMAALGTGMLAGCSGGDGGDSVVEETTDIAMVDSQFDPRNARVDVGATVTWTNEDAAGHTVSSASDNWEMDVTVDSGESVTHSFASSGVYDVYCRFHGSADLTGMSMKIAVGDATIDSPLGRSGSGGGGYG